MRTEAAKDNRTQQQTASGETPEPDGLHPVFPEPDLIDQAVTVPLYDIDNGIQLDDRLILGGEEFHIPEDGGTPEEELERHGHKLPHIPEKDNKG